MGYDVTMIVGETNEDKWIYPIAELELKCIGDGPLTKRIHRHNYSDGNGYWLYAQPRGERYRETIEGSTDTTMYSSGERVPTAEERYASTLEADVFRLDNHGNGLRPVPIIEAISLLREEVKTDLDKGEVPYRRFELALALLEATYRGWHKDHLPTVVFYGS